MPAGALAHGDASAHYLETGSLYPAFGMRPSQAAELKLMGLLEATQKAGYPIKVSLVGDQGDVNDIAGRCSGSRRRMPSGSQRSSRRRACR